MTLVTAPTRRGWRRRCVRPRSLGAPGQRRHLHIAQRRAAGTIDHPPVSQRGKGTSAAVAETQRSRSGASGTKGSCKAGEMAEKYATKFGLEIPRYGEAGIRAPSAERGKVGRSRQPVRAEQLAMTDTRDPAERFALPTLYQGGTQRAASASGGVILLFGVIVLVVATFPSGPLWAQLVTGGVGVLLVAVYVCRAIWCMGLRFDEGGIDLVRRAAHRRLRYEDVTGFTLGRYYQTRAVFVHTRDGASHVAVGVSVVDRGPFRTNEFRWKNGRSSDVLGRLQRHLEWVRTDGRAASRPGTRVS
jgi:hypothetical protein